MLAIPWHSPEPELPSDFMKPSRPLNHALAPIHESSQGPQRKEAGLGVSTRRMRKRGLGDAKQITQLGRGRPGIQSGCPGSVAFDTNVQKGREGGRASGRVSEDSAEEVAFKLSSEEPAAALQTWVWIARHSRGARPQGCIQSLAACQGRRGHDLTLASPEQPYLCPGSRAGGTGWEESGLWHPASQPGFESSLAAHQHVAVDELLSPRLPRGFRHPSLRHLWEALSSCSQDALQASGYGQALKSRGHSTVPLIIIIAHIYQPLPMHQTSPQVLNDDFTATLGGTSCH